MSRAQAFTSLFAATSLLTFACSDDAPSGTGGDTETGDGDGDPSGDGDPTGDGDGDPTGDGDGDPSGDGDGDPGPVCGDGNLDDGEACDDGNDLDTDACTSSCESNVCGDGFLNMGVEACDDGNLDDGDGCNASCELESCGDGVVQGAEECDDGNDLDTDECTSACTAAACGDGFVQDGEACDGNLDDDDGCSATCAVELKPNLLRCGTSQRNVADFIPMGVNLNVVASCTPDADTQAMLVTRYGVNNINAAALKTWVEGGGIVLTEALASDEVYNAVFNTAVTEGGFTGNCEDRAPTVVQFSAMDQFWADNMFAAIPYDQSGCGNNVANYPGLTPLAGWSMSQVSIGYRDAGAGRVWVTEFDWQDTQIIDASYDYTESLMGYMITTK